MRRRQETAAHHVALLVTPVEVVDEVEEAPEDHPEGDVTLLQELPDEQLWPILEGATTVVTLVTPAEAMTRRAKPVAQPSRLS